jgi:hypothetical protein
VLKSNRRSSSNAFEKSEFFVVIVFILTCQICCARNHCRDSRRRVRRRSCLSCCRARRAAMPMEKKILVLDLDETLIHSTMGLPGRPGDLQVYATLEKRRPKPGCFFFFFSGWKIKCQVSESFFSMVSLSTFQYVALLRSKANGVASTSSSDRMSTAFLRTVSNAGSSDTIPISIRRFAVSSLTMCSGVASGIM